MAKLKIALDGPAGSGKSTAAKRVAALLEYAYLDTGAMYRAAALAVLRAGVPLTDSTSAEMVVARSRIELRWTSEGTRVWLDGEEVTAEIRRPEAAQAASRVSTIPGVRAILVARQREFAAAGGVVMEGRDIGTVVLPDADLKIFLTASADVRARRRADELAARGETVNFDEMKREVVARDQRDTGRAASPLAAAPDAVIVDTTAMEAEEVARLIVLLARETERAAEAC